MIASGRKWRLEGELEIYPYAYLRRIFAENINQGGHIR
jgi:hypothetical protein